MSWRELICFRFFEANNKCDEKRIFLQKKNRFCRVLWLLKLIRIRWLSGFILLPPCHSSEIICPGEEVREFKNHERQKPQKYKLAVSGNTWKRMGFFCFVFLQKILNMSANDKSPTTQLGWDTNFFYKCAFSHFVRHCYKNKNLPVFS